MKQVHFTSSIFLWLRMKCFTETVKTVMQCQDRKHPLDIFTICFVQKTTHEDLKRHPLTRY